MCVHVCAGEKKRERERMGVRGERERGREGDREREGGKAEREGRREGEREKRM